MKCVKSVKSLKNYEIGEIIRITDNEADEKVRTGYWTFTSKSEWKSNLNSNLQKLKKDIDEGLVKIGVSEQNRNLVQKELNTMKKGKNKK